MANNFVCLKEKDMKEFFTSFFDNYQGKIKNPFIGTIIGVWFIHNWRIPFVLFNFDKECTMQDKINYIADYFGHQDFWKELINIIGYSFLILLFTFILMAISRSITDFYYKILEPFMITKIDKNEIFTTEKKLVLEAKIQVLEENLNSKREEITRTENNSQLINLKRDKIQEEFDLYKTEKNTEIKQLNDKYSKLKNDTNVTKIITDGYNDILASFNSNDIKELTQLIKEKRVNITKNSDFNDKMVELGFYVYDKTKANYKITEGGLLLMKFFEALSIDDLPF